MGIFDIAGKLKPRCVAGVEKCRWIEPHGNEEIDEWRIKYENAEDLAVAIGDIPDNFRAFVLLAGKFIFGDFIEALIVKNNWHCEELQITTLGLSEDNIDSLFNLLDWGHLERLELIVSDWFFNDQRRDLVPYLYQKLDVDNKLQVAVASVHTKMVLIKTTCGKKIIIHGSANFKSCASVENIVIENSPGLFDFMKEINDGIIARHKTLNKAIRNKELWRTVLGKDAPPEVKRVAKSVTKRKRLGV